MTRPPEPRGPAPAADPDAAPVRRHEPGPDIPQADPFLASNDAGERRGADALERRTSDDAAPAPDRDAAARGPREGAVDPLGTVPADSAIGTTHDPNSVTTGTSAEPTHDRFPPNRGRDDAREG